MAAATAEKPKAEKSSIEELAFYLGTENEKPLKEVLELFSEQTLAVAWATGDIELGRTKYITTGNPNVPESKPTLVIEDGIDWSGQKQRWHGRFSDVMKEGLPHCRFYQRYQREVCVSKDKDVWEWLEGEAGARETRWARRECTREEAEKLFDYRVRLTDKGMAALQA